MTVPEHPWYTVQFQRSLNGGATWTNVGSPDASSPVYTAFDTTAGLPDNQVITYRAVLDLRAGQDRHQRHAQRDAHPHAGDDGGRSTTTARRSATGACTCSTATPGRSRPARPRPTGPCPHRSRGPTRSASSTRSGSPTTRSASASSCTGPPATRCPTTPRAAGRAEPLLHPAREPAHLAQGGRRDGLHVAAVSGGHASGRFARPEAAWSSAASTRSTDRSTGSSAAWSRTSGASGDSYGASTPVKPGSSPARARA